VSAQIDRELAPKRPALAKAAIKAEVRKSSVKAARMPESEGGRGTARRPGGGGPAARRVRGKAH
jgi:hypothetical protein